MEFELDRRFKLCPTMAGQYHQAAAGGTDLMSFVEQRFGASLAKFR